MANELEYVNCIICGRSDAQVFARGVGSTLVVRCPSDGLLYKNPRPLRTTVYDFFRGNYIRDDNLAWFTAARQTVLKREAAAIKKIKSEGNLLDIGCATGTFFENFRDGKWDLYGVENSCLGAEVTRTQHDAKVFCGTLREAHYPSGFFDVVTFLDTIYYIPDPAAEFVEIRRVLKEDGLLAVEIPGLAYMRLRRKTPVSWLLHGKAAGAFTDSWYLYYFSPITLQRLLATTGFRTFQMIPEQASLSRPGLARVLNEFHFALARLLFASTGGRWSVSGKELYLAWKDETPKP